MSLSLESMIAGCVLLALFLFGIRVVRPTHRGLIERFGKYMRTVEQGFHWIIPVVERMVYVNITEQMADVRPQTVITKDNLNAVVDAVVYYKILDAKASQYNVEYHEDQIVSLARTTLRAVIGKMTFSDANENRDQINTQVQAVLEEETASYGVDVLRVEIQKIEAPKDVQSAMNEVVKAERLRIASTEQANAEEIRADGFRRAAIKEAEGVKQAAILKAQGKAQAIESVSVAQRQHFKEEAQVYRQLEVVERAIGNNAKIVLPEGKSLVNVVGDLAGLKVGSRDTVKRPE